MGTFTQPRRGLGKALASRQSPFSRVAWSAHVCPRHTSSRFNTGEANPVRVISVVDLLGLSFPANIYFLLAATERHTFKVGALPLSQPLEDQVMIFCTSCFFPHSTHTSPEDCCDLFKQRGCTQCLITRPDFCEIEELGCTLPCS